MRLNHRRSSMHFVMYTHDTTTKMSKCNGAGLLMTSRKVIICFFTHKRVKIARSTHKSTFCYMCVFLFAHCMQCAILTEGKHCNKLMGQLRLQFLPCVPQMVKCVLFERFNYFYDMNHGFLAFVFTSLVADLHKQYNAIFQCQYLSCYISNGVF